MLKMIKPPFIPKVFSDADSPYVDPEFTSLTPIDSYNAGDILANEDNPYGGFSYGGGVDNAKQSSINKENELFKQ
jgi:hypothetical protein